MSGPVETIIPGSCPDQYTLRRTWTATDRCGNSVMASQDIAVSDNTDPMFTLCPEGCTMIECRVPYPFSVTATDNCDDDVDVVCMLTMGDPQEVILTETGPGQYTIELITQQACGEVEVTCVATDDCGNSAMCSFQFECVDMACRLTGGGNRRDENHTTWGGQVGAPTASQPLPCGNWTHRQHSGVEGKWTFHAGTPSAPEGTAILQISCFDEGTCTPSGNPPSPARDVDFHGIGSFRNFHDGGTGLLSNFKDYIVPTSNKAEGTLHWFEVEAEDNGEPGNQTEPGANCPEEGTGVGPASCDCPDYYRIRIYQFAMPPHPVNNKLMYEVGGYHHGGNFQTHGQVFGGTCGGQMRGGTEGSLGDPRIPVPQDGGTIEVGEDGKSTTDKTDLDGELLGLDGQGQEGGLINERTGCDCPLCLEEIGYSTDKAPGGALK